MTITHTIEENQTVVSVAGRLDASTAPELEADLQPVLAAAAPFALDFRSLDYISSAGLRVLLAAQKAVNQNHTRMTVRHINETVAGIFEVTGFTDILTIE